MKHKLGVIGGGNMAEAILLGAISQGIIQKDQVIVAEPNTERRAVFSSHGLHVSEDNKSVVTQSEYILLAVKPQIFPKLSDDLKSVSSQTVISIMAGLSMATIQQSISEDASVIRVMPNTPLLVGAGMSAISGNEKTNSDQLAFCKCLFEAGGKVIEIEESLMDAVTAVSGSGPAYLFYLAEHMQKAAVSLGLKEHAALLTSQTLLGAATLLAESSDNPEQLRAKVTSPGGTTEAAINSMIDADMGQIVEKAIQKAENRAKELSSC